MTLHIGAFPGVGSMIRTFPTLVDIHDKQYKTTAFLYFLVPTHIDRSTYIDPSGYDTDVSIKRPLCASKLIYDFTPPVDSGKSHNIFSLTRV